MSADAERRKSERREDPPVEIADGWATVYNISVDGMCVVTTHPIEVGQVVRYVLKDATSDGSLEVRAEAIWVQSLISGLSRVGLRWYDPPPTLRAEITALIQRAEARES